MEKVSENHQNEPNVRDHVNTKLTNSWSDAFSRVNSDRDSHDYSVIDFSASSSFNVRQKPHTSNCPSESRTLDKADDNSSPIVSKDHDGDNDSLDADERETLLRQYDESCRMDSGDITLFEAGKGMMIGEIDIGELEEIDLEDGTHDTPAVLANFEDEAHEIERLISSGLAIFSSPTSPELPATSISSTSSMDLNLLTKAEKILHYTYERTSFLLKQNQRLAMKRETGPRTLTLRVSRCDSISRQYFALNRRVCWTLESERDFLLGRIRAWARALDAEVADRLEELDLRCGVSSNMDDDLLKTVWDERIVPFNERMSELSMKISLLDQRCNMLIKLIEQQVLLYRFTCFDSDFIHEVAEHIRYSALRSEQRKRTSYLLPLKIIAVMFIVGVSLNFWFVVGL